MGQIRGVSFIPVIKYIREAYGEEGFLKVLDNLPGEDRKVIEGKFEPMRWYPGKAFTNFLATADKVLGGGDYRLAYTTGIKGAEGTFSGLYRMFLEMGNPHTIIRRAPFVWRMINGTGILEIELEREKFARGKIKGFEDYDKAHCWHLVGYFQKVLELTGVRNVQVREVRCRSEGAEYCEFEVEWE